VREVFQEFGEITEIVILRDRRTGMHQGCCFVKYTTLAAARAAMAALHNQRSLPPLRNPLQVRLADSGGSTGDRGQTNAENKLFVGGVPGGCGDKDLRALFSTYGEVLDVYILASKASQEGQRGCAFVRYASPQSCAIAIEALHGKYSMKTGELPLVVRFADPPKNQRGNSNGYGSNGPNGRFPWGAGAPPGVWPTGPPPPGWPMPWAAMGMPYPPWVLPGMTPPQNGTAPYPFYGQFGQQQPQVQQQQQQQQFNPPPPPPPDNPTGAPPLPPPPQPAPAPSQAPAWTEHHTPEGLKYYYNNSTGTSSWECPPELRQGTPVPTSSAQQSLAALAPAMAALNVSTSATMGAFPTSNVPTSSGLNGIGSYSNGTAALGSAALNSLPSAAGLNGSLGGGIDSLGLGGLPGLGSLGQAQAPSSTHVSQDNLMQEVQLPHFLSEGANSGRGYESQLSAAQAISSMNSLNL